MPAPGCQSCNHIGDLCDTHADELGDAYQRNGYKDRDDYLKQLSELYDVDHDLIVEVAELLGPTEDFDGLVIALEDGDFGLSA